MDIERMKKLLKSGIEAGNKVKAVREVIKTYKTQKQDMYDDTAEILKPSIEVQKKVRETIDEKQDEMIKELQENQKALTKGLSDISEPFKRIIMFQEELPKMLDYEKSEEPEKQDEDTFSKGPTILDIDNNFNKNDKIILNNYKLAEPKYLTQLHPQKLMEEREQSVEIAKSIGRKKGLKNTSNEDKRSYDIELQTMKKYRETITDLLNSYKYLPKSGKGIYTQKKRNAYKISQRGQYGGLVIDLPKLYGHLKVVAHKNGQKVYDKQADFDTLDLLTKRFNSKKKYSEIARSVFNDLNRPSEIPIHRTSKKYSKLGSGVVYYNNPKDLLSRLELLGGSMSAGNDSSDVREEFTNIVHLLNKLNVIDNKQMNNLLKEYLI